MEKSCFFDSIGGDRKYLSEDFAGYFANVFSNGVFLHNTTALKVSAASGLAFSISTGTAVINGRKYENTELLSKTVDTVTANRIDRIVIRLDMNNRSIYAAIKKGTSASIPSAPTLERNADVWELGIADIYLAAGTTTITAAMITDLRENSTYCGGVTMLVDRDEIIGDITNAIAQFTQASSRSNIVSGEKIAVSFSKIQKYLTDMKALAFLATVGTSQIDNSAVTTAKIADGAVTTDKLNNGAVSAAKIAASAVSEAKIASGAVTSSKIADGAVGTQKIADSAVTTAKINDGAVTADKIKDGAVGAAKIGANAVTEGKIASGAVTSSKIGAGAVGTEKIADGAVTVAKMDLATLRDLIYPIGSIKITINNVNPGTYLGGTWVAFGAGRTLVGVDMEQTEFNTTEKTGGEKSHTLTTDEMPRHSHSLTSGNPPVGVFQKSNYSQEAWRIADGSGNGNAKLSSVTETNGSGAAHNNLQPYITCYIWKRTA